jgi:hypothetical protein
MYVIIISFCSNYLTVHVSNTMTIVAQRNTLSKAQINRFERMIDRYALQQSLLNK